MDEERKDKLLRAMLASAEGFRGLAYAAGGISESVGGVLCWLSRSRVPLFNGAAILSGAQISQETLDALFHYFQSRVPHTKYSVITLDNLTPGALRQMLHFGYKEYEELPVMWLDMESIRPEERPAPAALSIKRVSDPETLVHFRDVLQRTFFMPRDEVELIMSDRALKAENVRHYLGLLQGTPVATATLVLDGDVAGVWNVGTMPEWERQGIGGAMMRHILLDAEELGYKASMLLASPQGVPLYERLGYFTLDTMRVCVPDLEHENWLRFVRSES
jgi:GNAT superfamily N-acetyltransferase